MKKSMVLAIGQEKALLGHTRQGLLHFNHNDLVGHLSPVGVSTAHCGSTPDAVCYSDEAEGSLRLVKDHNGQIKLVG